LSFVAKATELKKAEVIRIHACPLLKNSKDGGQEWLAKKLTRCF